MTLLPLIHLPLIDLDAPGAEKQKTALDSVLGVGPAGAVDLPIEHGLKRIVESLERAF